MREDERVLADDVLDGLTKPFKELPPKHLYDTEGSRLFDAISRTPEYYPTRTERAILEAFGPQLVRRTGAAELVELGSGVPTKTRVLLDAMHAAGTLERYLPFDVSEAVLRTSAEQLVEEYPGLRVHGILGDFERHLPFVPPPSRRAARGTRPRRTPRSTRGRGGGRSRRSRGSRSRSTPTRRR